MGGRHTPGEWAAVVEKFDSAQALLGWLEAMLYAGGEFNFEVAYVSALDTLPTPPPEWSNGRVCVAFLGNGPTKGPNGSLIAAAPDLLAACEAIDRECLIGKLWSHEAREAVNALRAACRKARGEP